MRRRGLTLVAIVVVGGVLFAQLRPLEWLQLVLIDRAGVVTPVGKVPGITFAPRFSPDGKRIVYDTYDNGIWTADIDNVAAAKRVATGRFPIWSPAGSRIIFIAGSEAMPQMVSQAADGSGAPEPLVDGVRAPEVWLNDESLSYITLKAGNDYDLWSYSFRDRRSRTLIATPGSAQMSSRLSPDGRWLAYESNESGAFEIYVEPLPQSGMRTRLTTGGARRPVWSRDGSEIFFDRDGRLFVMTVETRSGVTAGPPKELPIKGFAQGAGRRMYDITPDGTQFLMLLP